MPTVCFTSLQKKNEYCAKLNGNTYIQNLEMTLGQYGGNEIAEPPILPFDNKAKENIKNIFGDQTAKVYFIE